MSLILTKLRYISTKSTKLDFMKLKNICSVKHPVKRMKRQAAD